MTTSIDELERTAARAWERSKPPLQRMYDTWNGNNDSEPMPDPTTFKIYDVDGNSFVCHLCGASDQWTLEGDPQPRSYVCDHGTACGLIRLLSSIAAKLVKRWELANDTNRPTDHNTAG